MSQIQPSIIYDDKGKPIGVIVPYDEWLKGQSAAPSKSVRAKRAYRTADLKGRLDWPMDPVEFQREVRADPPRPKR